MVRLLYIKCGYISYLGNFLNCKLKSIFVCRDLQTQERVVTSPLLLKGDTMAHVMDDLTQWTQPLRDSITKATLTFPQVVECPVIIPGSTPPDQATLGYSYRMLMGTYDTPNVDLTSSIMSVGPQTDSQLSRVRTCPST